MSAPVMVGGMPARVAEIQARMAALGASSARSRPTAVTATTGTQFASALQAAEGGSEDGPTGDQVITEAKKYLGIPYKWGGTDPATGLDCSGFTQLVFKNLGISIPRVSQDQANVGTPVASLADAKPGDLVILDGGGHVGIYVGNGQMIHAPKTGDVVKISPVWNNVTAIRRVVSPVATASSAVGPVGGAGVSAGERVKASVPYADLFNAAGAKHGVSPRLLAAMAKTESNFNPKAGSPAGAQGLMQFMPGTARSYGIDPWDPAQAVDGAARYIKSSLATFGGDVAKAVASYNAGVGAVQRHGGVPPYAETQNYVRLVTQRTGEMG